MGLTKTDLSKIGQVVDKRFDKRLKPLEKTVKTIDARLKSVEKDVKKIKKNTKYTVNFLDKNMIKLHKRTERIEEHLNLPPISDQQFL